MSIEMSKYAHLELEAEREKLLGLYMEARERVEHAQNGGGDGDGLAGVEAVFEAEEIGARLARVERALEEAVIVSGGGEVVGVGSSVDVDMGDGVESYAFESQAGPGRIGRDSPLGKALEGRRAGETVQVEAPGGTYTVKLIAVR